MPRIVSSAHTRRFKGCQSGTRGKWTSTADAVLGSFSDGSHMLPSHMYEQVLQSSMSPEENEKDY